MIEVTDIEKTYKTGEIETHALRGVSFSIDDGEFVAIMGPSGSGKSTMMHILGALDTPTQGTYHLDGKDVSTLTEDELADIRRSKIGFVFQSFNLLPRTTMMRNVMLPFVYESTVTIDDQTRRAKKVLAQVGLTEDLHHHKSNQLSGGQIQRVAIARALVNNPTLILADEPTGNLDTKTGDLVMDTFTNLNKEKGHTIVVITHEPEIAARAKRTIVLRDGLLVSDTKN